MPLTVKAPPEMTLELIDRLCAGAIQDQLGALQGLQLIGLNRAAVVRGHDGPNTVTG